METPNKKTTSEVIKAFVRVRPPISNEINYENCLKINLNKEINLKTEKYEIKCYYDYIFNEISSQEEVFNQIFPLLDDVLYGYNGCIFAYGQTSAGKVISFFHSFLSLCSSSFSFFLSIPHLLTYSFIHSSICFILLLDTYYAWSKWWTRFKYCKI